MTRRNCWGIGRESKPRGESDDRDAVFKGRDGVRSLERDLSLNNRLMSRPPAPSSGAIGRL